MASSDARLAIVTGASRGLGRLISVELLKAGLDVLMVGRDEESLRAAAAEENGAGKSHPFVCDLEAEGACERVVAAAGALGRVEVLINNAAIQGPVGPSWTVEAGEFERTLWLDFLVPVTLCRMAVPAMAAQRAGWIINISGGGATAARPSFAAYGCAKTALVRFTETLAAELTGYGVSVNSIAPGAFRSRMTEEVARAGELAGIKECETARRLLEEEDDAAAQKAAKLVRYLVAGEGRGITGRLISAVWDPWSELHEHAAELAASDIYTLRRIVPSERGKSWGSR